MKINTKLSFVTIFTISTTSLLATNGSNLIGVGAKARGMGGTGIGIAHGAESALANPALITSIKDTEISFGGTIFMPKVKTDMGSAAGSYNSDADINIIPSVSIANKINDNFYFGIGMWGTAGMGVDYRDVRANFEMVTNLQLMQFGTPLAYTTNGFSIAVTPLLQYGSLDINYNNGLNQGSGVSQDLEFGYNLGFSYEVSSFTIGAIYKSQIDMKYKGQLSNAMQNFGLNAYKNDELSTPSEIGIGLSYRIKEHIIAIDYKNIQWSKAKGYEDFKWEDQNVYALGYEYSVESWAIRIGYNYAETPIKEQNGFVGSASIPSSGLVNTFNLLGFPAIVESHISIGSTYKISNKTSVDLAYTYAPEVSKKFLNHTTTQYTETKHSQTALSVGLNYAF
nr:porin [uncultured Sulfurimonas sp.]